MISRRTFLGTTALPLTRGSPSPHDIRQRFAEMWERNRTYTLEVAERMPDSGYGFRPVPEVRSFAEQLAHIGQAVDSWTRLLTGASPAGATGRTVIGDPSTLRTELDASMVAFADAWLGLRASDLERSVPWSRRLGSDTTHTLEGVALTAWHHTAHHRAQCIVYLRLNGLEPPAYVD